LRRDRRSQKLHATFDSLISAVTEGLATLGYEQRPVLTAPSKIKMQKIPLRLD
jgi:hypothetical protein